MSEIDNERFGAFLLQLRKEKGLTQKDLAEKLYISDKAVSKWERGLSLPDIALLMPLAEYLGVTTTELLSARRLEAGERMDVQQVEELVTDALGRSVTEHFRQRAGSKRRTLVYVLCAAVAVAEVLLILSLGYTATELADGVFLVVGMSLGFGAWFTFFAPERLPAYYDQNNISAYSQGAFRMNLPGVRFNNSNWPYILRAGRLWLLAAEVSYPLVWLVGRKLLPEIIWLTLSLPLTLVWGLGMLFAMMAAGKKHQ